MHIYTNFNLKSSEHKIDFENIPKQTPWRIFIETSRRFKSYDVILLTLPSFWHIVAATLMKKAYRRTLLIYWDLNLVPVVSVKTYILAKIKGWLLNNSDCIMLMHKDWSGYQHSYGIKLNILRYVPFNSNNIDIIHKFDTVNSEYVLSLGLSYRDYDTFFKAMKICGYPSIAVLPQVRMRQNHSTRADLSLAGKNVTIISDDIDRIEWNRLISKAKMLVISIKKNTLQPAGISVYLEAMALGKPVIITEGTTTKGILDKTLAEIIPPESVEDMTESIRKLWNDQEHANLIASEGKKYALSLGNDEDLSERLINIIRDLRTKGH